MRKFFRFVLPIVVLAACIGIGMSLIRTAPKAERRQAVAVTPVVEVLTARESDYPVLIKSQGTVVPRTESTLIPEVSGQIVRTSPNFHTGGFFGAGEVLVEIDPRDYENSTVVAEAELARANAALDEEKARVDQALRDWEVLKLAEEPNDLALRKPQLKSAQAAVAASEARLQQAKTNLERTRIRAPYAGLVREKRVDVGQYVSPGNVLAKIYAVDFVEIRLPLTNNQLGFLELPAFYGERDPSRRAVYPEVELIATVGRQTHRWSGRVVRTEGAIDTQSQQIFVIAQIDNPYAPHHGIPLQVGQFVEAHIRGRVLDSVFVMPRSVLRRGDEVLIVNQDGTVERRTVVVAWSDDDQVVISQGLSEGDQISLTVLPFAVSGTKVQITRAATNDSVE